MEDEKAPRELGNDEVNVPPLMVWKSEEHADIIDVNQELNASLDIRDQVKNLPKKKQIELLEEYWHKHIFVSDAFVELIETLKQEVREGED
jgi:hypothetical protein